MIPTYWFKFWNMFHLACHKRETTMAKQIQQLCREIEGERDARHKCEAALRQKDEGMGVLFDRLNQHGIDCSDLIS